MSSGSLRAPFWRDSLPFCLSPVAAAPAWLMFTPVVRIGRVALNAALPIIEDMLGSCVGLCVRSCRDAERIQSNLCAVVCLTTDVHSRSSPGCLRTITVAGLCEVPERLMEKARALIITPIVGQIKHHHRRRDLRVLACISVSKRSQVFVRQHPHTTRCIHSRVERARPRVLEVRRTNQHRACASPTRDMRATTRPKIPPQPQSLRILVPGLW